MWDGENRCRGHRTGLQTPSPSQLAPCPASITAVFRHGWAGPLWLVLTVAPTCGHSGHCSQHYMDPATGLPDKPVHAALLVTRYPEATIWSPGRSLLRKVFQRREAQTAWLDDLSAGSPCSSSRQWPLWPVTGQLATLAVRIWCPKGREQGAG